MAVTVVASWSRSGPATSAVAARRSESGWPRASRLIRSRSSPSTPSCRRSCSASSRGRLPSGSAPEQATHADRPARERRFAAGEDDARVVAKAGTKVCCSQRSIGRRTSYRSRTRTTRSPRLASRAAASSAVVRSPPVALEIAARKPRGVGSIVPESRRRTIAPRPRASAVKASTSAGLADAADAVDEDDQRAFRTENAVQEGALGLAPDEARTLGLDPLADREGHLITCGVCAGCQFPGDSIGRGRGSSRPFTFATCRSVRGTTVSR